MQILNVDITPRADIIKLIHEHGGVIQRVCKALGCSRTAWDKRFRDDQEILAEIEKARYSMRETRLDVAESVLSKLMSEAEKDRHHAYKASVFYLLNHGGNRGYGMKNLDTKEQGMAAKIDDIDAKIMDDYTAIKDDA